MNEAEPYLHLVLKSHDQELMNRLIEIGQMPDIDISSDTTSAYEEDLRNRIVQHAIQIDALNCELLGIRLRRLQAAKEAMELAGTA